MEHTIETKPETGASLALTVATTGLEPESAISLRAAFVEMFDRADEWAARAAGIRVTSSDQKREMKLARESRLALREIRVKAEHARKRLKEDSSRRGKAIDGIANALKALIEPIEEHLLEQETFAEREQEAARNMLREAREAALRAYGADPAVYANLGATDETTWTLTLDAARVAHEAKIEAAKHAEAVRVEAERIAAEKREAVRAAALRLEAERVERERATAAEAERLRAERVELEEKHRAEREAAAREAAEKEAAAAAARAELDAAHRAEREAAALEAAEKEALAAKERAEAERVAAELAAAKRAETERVERERAAAAEAERVEAEKQASAAAAPDKQKLIAYVSAVRAIPIPTLATPAGQALAGEIREQIDKLAKWVAKKAGQL